MRTRRIVVRGDDVVFDEVFVVSAETGKDGTPVIFIDAPELSDNENGPICRIYLNDGILWANPDYGDAI